MSSTTDAALPAQTGRTIVVMDRRARPEQAGEALESLGIHTTTAESMSAEAAGSGTEGSVYLEHLGVAILQEEPEAVSGALTSAIEDPRSPILATEPEVVVTVADGELGEDGFLVAEDDDVPDVLAFTDTDHSTWGVRAVHAVPPLLHRAPWSGTGVCVAVLDTGIDLGHPDLAGQVVGSASFISGQAVQDGHGHGTHVAGTVAAHRSPAGGQRRYSVAPGARLLIGKVLGDNGSGSSGGVLAGINWAIASNADVISMSLGSNVALGAGYSPAYETAARAALDSGCLVIAAAGNAGYQPVGSPANCPSILAVAALDHNLQRASFSCVGLNGDGGEVNIAAPGVGTFSAWPVTKGSYANLNGTSMATPHVSGVAAILAQATGLRGRALASRLLATVTPLPQRELLVGKGLAKAPTRPWLIIRPPFPILRPIPLP
ncbi:S8 family serine peptidase [Serinibacter salmoneus]|uniref:Subtilase family protein n=1 Tax=Serinibacter salmoneus TaxID=556530 RepID=A0A2A9CW22_9MICO|nr:S8 family serine peptidase [Serinibacter salmoneus]PFG18627.1 subtilase family protein [Serinibacter salmoneus]